MEKSEYKNIFKEGFSDGFKRGLEYACENQEELRRAGLITEPSIKNCAERLVSFCGMRENCSGCIFRAKSGDCMLQELKGCGDFDRLKKMHEEYLRRSMGGDDK